MPSLLIVSRFLGTCFRIKLAWLLPDDRSYKIAEVGALDLFIPTYLYFDKELFTYLVAYLIELPLFYKRTYVLRNTISAWSTMFLLATNYYVVENNFLHGFFFISAGSSVPSAFNVQQFTSKNVSKYA